MIKRILFISFCFSSIYIKASAKVSSYPGNMLNLIVNARSTKELNQIQSYFKDQGLYKAACKIEISEQRLPYNCFKSLQLSLAWENLSAIEYSTKMHQLDIYCQKVLGQFSLVDPQNLLAKPEHLPKSCARSLKEKMKLANYAQETARLNTN